MTTISVLMSSLLFKVLSFFFIIHQQTTQYTLMFIYFYLFIYFYFWLHQVFVVACGIFIAACGIFFCCARALPCNTWASLQLWRAGFSLVVAHGLQSAWAQQLWHAGLVALWHVGSQFPDQGSNPHPLHWKADSLPLDHQGSPQVLSYFRT